MNRKRWVAGVVVAGWWAGAAGLRAAELEPGGCASTPAAALVAARKGFGAGASAAGETHGYRVDTVRWDPLLRQSWAVIRSCDHLAWPSFTMLADLPGPHAAASAMAAGTMAGTPADRSSAMVLIVHVGDLVRLWKSDRYARIEMTGTSEENGAVGARVRVRLVAAQAIDGRVSPTQFLAGVVRGPNDVEMER